MDGRARTVEDTFALLSTGVGVPVESDVHIPVADEFLDGADVVASVQQVSGESVAEGAAIDPLVDAGRAGDLAHGLLGTAWAEVVAVYCSPLQCGG